MPYANCACEHTVLCCAPHAVLCCAVPHPQAQRTKFAKPLVEKAARAILLSGTPALSNPSELLSQLQALLPKARLTKTAFEERYMDVRQYGNFRKAVRVCAGVRGGGAEWEEGRGGVGGGMRGWWGVAGIGLWWQGWRALHERAAVHQQQLPVCCEG
jgi:hypothetical protein